jgi:hypothetical protein
LYKSTTVAPNVTSKEVNILEPLSTLISVALSSPYEGREPPTGILTKSVP